MRRALPALLATAGGLALLANFHTAAGVKPRASAVPTTSTTTPPAGSSPPPSGTTAPTTSTTGVRQLDGPVISTQFGDVQVRVTLSNRRITDVQPMQMPFDRRHSQEITQAVTPLLHDEVLQAQSAANRPDLRGNLHERRVPAIVARCDRSEPEMSIGTSPPHLSIRAMWGTMIRIDVRDAIDRLRSTSCGSGSSGSTTSSALGVKTARSLDSRAVSSSLRRRAPKFRRCSVSVSR